MDVVLTVKNANSGKVQPSKRRAVVVGVLNVVACANYQRGRKRFSGEERGSADMETGRERGD